MKSSKVIILLFALSLILPSLLVIQPSDGADEGDSMVLVDMGNGITYWIKADASITSTADVIKDSLERLGLDYSYVNGSFVIEDKQSTNIGNVSSYWNYYEWDGEGWRISNLDNSQYSGQDIAMGFYPSYLVPTETPDYMTSWTMTRGNAEQTGHQTTDISSSEEAKVVFEKNYGNNNYVCSVVLVSGNKVFVVAGGGYTASNPDPTLYCYDRFTFEELWSFSYPKGAGYETATGAIIGDYYFLPATNGTLYKIPLDGPGENNENVGSLEIPDTADHQLTGNTYSTGPSSITYDSGVIYFGSSNGYVYCVDPNLNTSTNSDPTIIWKTPVGGCIYYMNVTVKDGLLYAGALDGHLYIMDSVSGQLMISEKVFTIERSGRTYGQVAVPVIVDGKIIVSFSDGNGMNTVSGGIAIYEYTGTSLNRIYFNMDVGVTGTFLLPMESDDFTGVYFTSINVPLGRLSIDGIIDVLRDDIETVKAGLILVNDEYVFLTEYRSGGSILKLDLDGNTIGRFKQPDGVSNWAMVSPTVVDDYIYAGTDGGFYVTKGTYPAEPESGDQTIPGWLWLTIILIALIALLTIYYLYLKRTKDMPPMTYMKTKVSALSGINNERLSKTKQNKRRLILVIIFGTVISFVMFLCCLSFGPSGTIPLTEALSSLVSAISKQGHDLTYTEIIVFESRLPRAIAAIGVGMGLAVAGTVYQAIIRNPLVDPYIMGVSSGAGTFAVAALVANFTFFGLLEGSNYAVPILAVIGGLAAFFITMLIAEKAGGSTTNFVLAGVIVGLAFSSIMTVMLVTAQSDSIQSALSWLYGSFANIGWDTIWLTFIPALFLSFVPLIWAKELNLVLLGEEQAQQMGLNVRRFNRWMLILASVLTAICVAFVGIIGFVGLVVPHVCRMIMGGDHRLVLPASIVLGGALMLFADFLARMIMIPMELPVGAITTIIGVPLFAYLLIKRGRMYDG